MHNFEGSRSATLQPGDTKKPYEFEIKVCSSQTANDGWIPYGTNMASIAVTAHKDDGTDVTSTMIEGDPTEVANVITVLLNHISEAGEYYLYFILTLNTTATIGVYFRNVKVKS